MNKDKRDHLSRAIFFIVVIFFLYICFDPEYLNKTFDPLLSRSNGLGLGLMIFFACAAIYSFYKFFK